MNDNLMLLLQLLADNAFHNGDDLAEKLNVTRAAISKWVKKLNEQHIVINSVKGKGYQLNPQVNLLDEAKLKKQLSPCFELILKYSLDSTNDEVKRVFKSKPSNKSCLLATTEQQTQGRGRRGRQWIAPVGENLAFTLGLTIAVPISQLSGLSIAVGLSIADSLKQLGFPIQLKWPNDLYLEGKKLAGILVELEGAFDSYCNVIIGIGINVNMLKNQSAAQNAIDQAWTSLAEYKGEVQNRSDVLIKIANQLEANIALFIQQGLENQLLVWQDYDYFYQQKVTLLMPNQTVSGICQGINKEGALLLKTSNGLEVFVGGEISVRANADEE